jgi:hypothetical protein
MAPPGEPGGGLTCLSFGSLACACACLLDSARWRRRGGGIVEPQYCLADIDERQKAPALTANKRRPLALICSSAAPSFYFLSQENREKSWDRLRTVVMNGLFFIKGNRHEHERKNGV